MRIECLSIYFILYFKGQHSAQCPALLSSSCSAFNLMSCVNFIEQINDDDDDDDNCVFKLGNK